MKKLTTLVTSVAFAATIATGLSTPVVSAMNTPEQGGASTCTVKGLGTPGAGDSSHRYTVNSDGTVTARFKVKGDHCKVTLTLVSWTAPNGTDGKPYSAQKHYSHTIGTFKPGDHSMTTKLPNCFYQVDLIQGTKWDLFPAQPFEHGVITSIHGGTQSCTPPVLPPTTPPTELPHTGAGIGTLLVTVLGSIVISTLGYRRYLSRHTA
jgi:hypothetical protein